MAERERARTRPQHTDLSLVDTIRISRQVKADEQVRRLSRSAREALLTFIEFMDGAGCAWPKCKVWAAAANMSESTLDRAIVELKNAGLLDAQPYLVPPVPGKRAGRNGSAIRRLNPRFLSTGGTADGAARGGGAGSNGRVASRVVPRTGGVTGGATERNPGTKSRRAGAHAGRPAAPVCIECGVGGGLHVEGCPLGGSA